MGWAFATYISGGSIWVLGASLGCGAFRLPLNLVVLLLPAHGNLFATTGEGTHFRQRFILGGPQTFNTAADNCNR